MQRNILLFGAGKSSPSLIHHLLSIADEKNLHINILDTQISHLKNLYGEEQHISLIEGGIDNINLSSQYIEEAFLVISMLPAFLHPRVAKICLQYKKSLFTASYVSDEMRAMDSGAKEAGVLFLNEAGLDPGIDHMSALRLLNKFRAKGAEITDFISYTGGLIAPESDTNPWHYKFTWNPRNVVLAAQGGVAKYKEDGEFRYLAYSQVFKRLKQFDLGEWGVFEGYANRDSLAYRDLYDLHNAKTLIRGTIRAQGFCAAWDIFVQCGLTDNATVLHYNEAPNSSSFFSSFLPGNGTSLERLERMLGHKASPDVIEQLNFLGLLDGSYQFTRKDGTAAEFLQDLLEEKWCLEEDDKDMIVMVHRVQYTLNGEQKSEESRLRVIGEDKLHTAMAKTVGLPLAYCVEAFLDGKYNQKGVQIPNDPDLYNRVLDKLESQGIVFEEKEIG